MKKGRPTKQQSRKIRNQLWSYFVTGCSTPAIIQKSGFDKKTVYKYFDEWNKQYHDNDEKDFQEKIRKEKDRVDVAYDNLLLELDESLNEIKKEMKFYKSKNEFIPRYLYGYHLHFVKDISSLIEKRTSVRMMPPLEETITEIVKKELEKNDHK
jgi:hypothetical protein